MWRQVLVVISCRINSWKIKIGNKPLYLKDSVMVTGVHICKKGGLEISVQEDTVPGLALLCIASDIRDT